MRSLQELRQNRLCGIREQSSATLTPPATEEDPGPLTAPKPSSMMVTGQESTTPWWQPGQQATGSMPRNASLMMSGSFEDSQLDGTAMSEDDEDTPSNSLFNW